MTGSLLQLVSVGPEDAIFIGNPQISFFKRIYLRHTNFSIERFSLRNIGNSQLKSDIENVFNFYIPPQEGDLLYYTAFSLELPEIFADTDHQFRWIENIGDNIIQEASIFINGVLLERLEGSFFNISNTLHLNNNSNEIYNSLTKNLDKFYNPCIGHKYPYSSNNSEYLIKETDYEIINKHYSDIPSIDSQRIYIPIPFFINRIKEFFIPLTLLRNSKIQIQIKLRPIHDLYTIGYPNIDNNYYKFESFYNNSTKSIYDFVKNTNFILDCKSELYYYVIFLENKEKNIMASTELSHFITTPKLFEFLGLRETSTIKLKNKDIIDKLFILPKRSDIKSRNQWSNYTIYDDLNFKPLELFDISGTSVKVKSWCYRRPDEMPTIDINNIDYFKTSNIIKNLTLKLDGSILDQFNESEFLYNSSKYETFKNNYLDNIIIYKFSEFPLEDQPSGHLNLNMVTNFEIDMEFKNSIRDTGKQYDFDVDVILMRFKKFTYKRDEVVVSY